MARHSSLGDLKQHRPRVPEVRNVKSDSLEKGQGWFTIQVPATVPFPVSRGLCTSPPSKHVTQRSLCSWNVSALCSEQIVR